VESSKQISADLKSILLEKHLNFELLNTYKGVPFICKAALEAVEAESARFGLHPASAYAWGTVNHTLILSEGLLEPIEARLQQFDRAARAIWVDRFVYAGSKLSNRKELRVEPAGAVEILLEADGEALTAHLADLSMRGAGVRLAGKIRNLTKLERGTRLSLEFTGGVSDKTLIVRFIMRRRAEITVEMQAMAARE
jgi:hypothetical protein